MLTRGAYSVVTNTIKSHSRYGSRGHKGRKKEREIEVTGKFHFTPPLVLSLVNIKGGVRVQIPAASFSGSYLNLFPHLRRVVGRPEMLYVDISLSTIFQVLSTMY